MSSLPSYVASAKPVPQANRVPWYSSTAQTYAGIMLWFVFWQQIPTGGALDSGLGTALLGVVLAALICHFLFYLVPGMLGMKTGLPLYIVGTSTYGVNGGFIMPGFLMGALQFGWLAVNAYFSGFLLVAPFGFEMSTLSNLSPVHCIVSSIFAIGAAFIGLKGIGYVAKISTFFPLIPLTILILLTVKTIGGVGNFSPEKTIPAPKAAVFAAESAATAAAPTPAPQAAPALSKTNVILLLMTVIVGFFATAGAAGCDFGQNNRDAKDVQLGGLVGVAGATIFAGGLALLIVAGAYGSGIVNADHIGEMNPTKLMADILGEKTAAVCMYLLAIAAFPSGCFSTFIAANSFKTTLPNVNPFISCGIGALFAIVLVVTGWAGQAVDVFSIIGASFGPICGAMAADYLLAGRQWAGPRAGFNPAGWISWAVGFTVGALPLVSKFVPALQTAGAMVPAAPLSAFVVGFVLYLILAKLGLESTKLEMPRTAK